MSNAAITWARQQTTGSSSAKCILLVLADAARDHPQVSAGSGKTWPPLHAYLSISSLCKATEQDRKTVIKNLHLLEGKGFVVRAGQEGQTSQVTVYRLPVATPKTLCGAPTSLASSPSAERNINAVNGTVPLFPANSTEIPTEQYRYSAPTVPKAEHEPLLNPAEPCEPTERRELDLFGQFWSIYPRKVSKLDAQKAFAKCNPTPSLLAQMRAAIAAQAQVLNWTTDRIQYVPHPATWLNRKRWLDDVPIATPTANVDRHPRWALEAGFSNIEEAHNERCYEHNASDFRNGRRIQEVIA